MPSLSPCGAVQADLSADAVGAVFSPLLGNYLSWAGYLNIKSNIVNPGYAHSPHGIVRAAKVDPVMQHQAPGGFRGQVCCVSDANSFGTEGLSPLTACGFLVPYRAGIQHEGGPGGRVAQELDGVEPGLWHLCYCALFLLVWGEAANVRFMPECLCYIFHHVRLGARHLLRGGWTMLLCQCGENNNSDMFITGQAGPEICQELAYAEGLWYTPEAP